MSELEACSMMTHSSLGVVEGWVSDRAISPMVGLSQVGQCGVGWGSGKHQVHNTSTYIHIYIYIYIYMRRSRALALARRPQLQIVKAL